MSSTTMTAAHIMLHDMKAHLIDSSGGRQLRQQRQQQLCMMLLFAISCQDKRPLDQLMMVVWYIQLHQAPGCLKYISTGEVLC